MAVTTVTAIKRRHVLRYSADVIKHDSELETVVAYRYSLQYPMSLLTDGADPI